MIYLLDRRLLSFSYDELVLLKPLRDKEYRDLARLWRHRHPDEYAQFQRALEGLPARVVARLFPGSWERDANIFLKQSSLAMGQLIKAICFVPGVICPWQIFCPLRPISFATTV